MIIAGRPYPAEDDVDWLRKIVGGSIEAVEELEELENPSDGTGPEVGEVSGLSVPVVAGVFILNWYPSTVSDIAEVLGAETTGSPCGDARLVTEPLRESEELLSNQGIAVRL